MAATAAPSGGGGGDGAAAADAAELDVEDFVEDPLPAGRSIIMSMFDDDDDLDDDLDDDFYDDASDSSDPKIQRIASQVKVPQTTMSDIYCAQAHEALCSAPVQEWHDRQRAIDGMRKNNPIPADAGREAHVPEKHFAKTKQKLYRAVPTRYGETTQVPTIYRVPFELRRYSEMMQAPAFYHVPLELRYGGYKDYLPVAVHIGGFAYKFDRMMFKLEEYKWCCVRQLISRHTRTRLLEPAKTHVLLLECMESMKRLLPRIRASYAQDISTNDDDEIAEMMLLDGCFILHRLLKYARRAAAESSGDQLGEEEDDDWTQVYGRCWVWQFVTRDLLLLQNQIPFFVLQKLFQQLRNDDEPEELLVTGGLRLFRSLRPQMMHRSPIAGDHVHHLLHLFYLSVGFPRSDVHNRSRHQRDVLLPELPQWVPCARELEEAGVRFRKRKNAMSFLDIRFDFRRGVLEIPPLQLYDSSSALFRNLIAFEQAYPDTRCDVSTYAVFMDCLINTPEDMRILHLRGILVNQMNSEQDASRFFSQICAQVHFSADNYLVNLMGKVSKYTDCRRHKWRAALVRNYFSNPWLVMSVLAAVLLISMTALQTFFTVYPYFKPAK